MPDHLVVLMNGVMAGTIERLANNRLRLDYDPAYRSRRTATPLSVSLPVAIASHADDPERQHVTNLLWGLLPDNDQVIQTWASHYNVRTSSPFFLLGTPVGEDCAGAVSFRHPEDLERVDTRDGGVEWLSEADVATLLRDLRANRSAWLGRQFTGQFSLAGAQAKTALFWDGDRWGQPRGATPTTHILKPGIRGLAAQEVNEHLSLAAAHIAGLVTTDSRIAMFEDQLAIVSTRYDRDTAGGQVQRVHQEDICQALSVSPQAKYENHGGPGARSIAALLRRSMSPSIAEASVRDFAKALAWNWIIAGTDAHAKNYSLLLAGGQVRLAPLYDLSSFLPYLEQHEPGLEYLREQDIRLAMRVGGTYDLAPVRNTWPRAADDLGIPEDELIQLVRELTAAAPAAFARAAADPTVQQLRSPMVDVLVDRIANRSSRCAAVL